MKVDRFGDIAIGVELIGAEDILVRLRRREHHDRDLRKIGVRLDFRRIFLPHILSK